MGIFTGNLKTLKLVAIYGGAASLLGAAYFSNKIQDNFRRQPFYKESLKILRGYPVAIKLLGQPIISRRVNLGNPDNYVDGFEARLTVPVKGPNATALLHTWCSRPSLDEKWIVQKLDLEFNNKQWTFYINPEGTGQYKPTQSLEDVLNRTKSERHLKEELGEEQSEENELAYFNK